MESESNLSNFELKIINQAWLGDEPEQFDLCSHGQLLLIINEKTILDGRETYGLSESALALLRTLTSDHDSDSRLAEKLIFHGCGRVLMQSCPIGVDWSVSHQGDQVILSDVKRWDWPDENRPTHFPGLQVSLPKETYHKVVLTFAEQVRLFFQGREKVFIDDADRFAYQKFWQEFERRSEEA